MTELEEIKSKWLDPGTILYERDIRAMHQDIAWLVLEIEELTAMLREMVQQHCANHEGWCTELNSGGLSTNADAMMMLAKRGELEIIGEPVGRMVRGRWVK